MSIITRKYFYAIDGSQGLTDNPTDWLNSLFTINDILHTSVDDMVTKILGRLASDQVIANLFIGGHGAPGYQSVGAGTGWDTSGARSLQCDPTDTTRLRGTAHGDMRRISSRFTSDAIVTLGGCKVGQDDTLLQAVSGVLGGIAVQAGKDNQRPLFPGMEGDVVRCTGTGCTNLGGGSWWSSPGSWIQ